MSAMIQLSLRLSRLLLVLTACMWAPSCVIDTVPLPENTPAGERDGTGTAIDDNSSGYVNPNSGTDSQAMTIDTSAIFHAESTGAVLLFGVPWAVPGAGRVVVTNASRGSEDSIGSAANGSFAASVNAAIGDEIGIDFLVNDVAVASAVIQLGVGSASAFEAAGDLDENIAAGASAPATERVIIDADNDSETVTVTGTVSSLNPGLSVIIANPNSGVAAESRPDADGHFTATLAGRSGDLLLIFTVEPAISNGGSIPIEVVVP